MTKLKWLIAILLLISSPSYAMVVGYSRSFSSGECSADFFSDDFSLGSRTTDVTGSGTYWDGETDGDGDLVVSGGAMVLTLNNTTDAYVFLDNDTSSNFLDGTQDEITGYLEFEVDTLTWDNDSDMVVVWNEAGTRVLTIYFKEITGALWGVRAYGYDADYNPGQQAYTYSTGTTYCLWFYYKGESAAAAGDGKLSAYLRPSGGSWTQIVDYSAGDEYASKIVDRITVGKDLQSGSSGTATINITYDNISVKEGLCDRSNY